MIRFLTFIDNSLQPFFRRVEKSTIISTEQLARFRVFFGATLLVYFLPSWSWLNDVPPGFFDPYFLSFAYLTEGYLPAFLYLFFDIIVILLLLMITLGIHTRKSLLLMYVISSIMYSYSFSFGKIDHYTNLFLFTYPVLAFTNCGTKFALVRDRKVSERTQKISLIVLGITIAFGYFNAGLAKCMEWIDFDLHTSGFLDWIYYCFFNSENQYLLAPYLFRIPTYLFEPLDYVAALFEISGFFFLLKGRKYWIFYLTVACMFHLINLLFFNLSFALNTLCYGIFLISPLLNVFSKKSSSVLKRFFYLPIGLIIATAIFKLLLLLSDLPVYNYHNYAPLIHLELIIDFLLWTFTIICGVFLLGQRRKSNGEIRSSKNALP